jgi:sporulation protein YlmC with PRC-barrel domain
VLVAEAVAFTIGSIARCTDGVCGRLNQVVFDPIKDQVTHLIVEPEHREGLGRLVPIDLAQARAGEIALNCTQHEFDELDTAEEVRFLPGTEGYGGYEPSDFLLWPYFGGNATEPVVVDTLPVGEVAVRRGEAVHAADGQVGEVEGLIIDGRNDHVTHLLLKRGHLFGQRDVAIPIGEVAALDADGIRLSMRKDEVGKLPAVAADPPTK